jgi:hypothetical protein
MPEPKKEKKKPEVKRIVPQVNVGDFVGKQAEQTENEQLAEMLRQQLLMDESKQEGKVEAMAQFNEEFGEYKIVKDPEALHKALDKYRAGVEDDDDVDMDPDNPPGTSLLSAIIPSFSESLAKPASEGSKKKIYPKRSKYVVPATPKKDNLKEASEEYRKTGRYGFQDQEHN